MKFGFTWFAVCCGFVITSLWTAVKAYNETDIYTNVAYENVTNLYKDILPSYDKRVRPVRNQSHAVTVTFVFSLSNIIYFDTAYQRLSVLGTFFFFWNDEYLKWDYSSYGGLKVAKLPLSQVWAPTMILSKCLDGKGVIGHPTDIVTYTNSGHAAWAPEGLFNVVCDVNIKFFPFDIQTCKLTVYVSDAYYTEVNLEPLLNGVTLELYYPNMEWDLMDTYIDEKTIYVGVKLVTIALRLRRRMAYLMYTVVAPLMLLSILNVGVFLVPVDTGEKGSISVTIFLSYGVFISTISDQLPHHSIDTSYLLVYILLLLIQSVVTVLYTFIQSWIFIYHVDKKVSVKLFRAVFKLPETKDPVDADEIKQDTDTDKTLAESDTNSGQQKQPACNLTWRMILWRIDLAFFVMFSAAVILVTTAYLSYLRIGGLL